MRSDTKISKPKSTAIEKEKRLFTVQGWMLEGVDDRLIIKQIMALWNISIRQAQRYIKDAYNGWQEVEGVKIENKRLMMIASLKQDIRSLRPEFKGTPSGLRAVKAIKTMIIKLEGMELPKKIDVTSNGESINYRPFFGDIDSVLEDDKADDRD